MPELPEVTIIVNSLDKKLRGLELDSVEYDWAKKFYWGDFSLKDIKGAKIKGVSRRGKVILIETDKKITFVIHLKLTGQLIYQDNKTRVAGGHPIPPLNLPVPNKTTRVTFSFTNGGHLYFNDLRKFGWVKVVSGKEEEIKKAIGAELGPDPLVMSYQQFRERLVKKPQGRIKKVLMDQQVVSGIGNIYSDEGLWRAKIHPKRSIVSLTDAELKAVFKGVRDSMNLAISKGGSSANSFVGSGGERGLYLSFANAYHRIGKPCARCKMPIVGERMDGRTAHYCPNCQRLG